MRTPSLAERQQFLRGIPLFSALDDAARAALAELLEPEEADAGKWVVTEGEAGDKLYLILRGRVEVCTLAGGRIVPLAVQGRGEVFGEIALLSSHPQRQATVIALTDLELLALRRQAFEAFLSQHPELRAAFREMADRLLLFKFLRVASPFTALDEARVRDLMARVEHRKVAAGEVVMREGEPGDRAYLVYGGRLDVRQTVAGQERHVATLNFGALFGELALLTEGPRTATVRAVEDTDLLALRREDLLAVLRTEEVRVEVLRMMRVRERPLRRPQVELYRRATADGGELCVLKDPERGVYHQLPPLGLFVWERLDGTRNMRDLTLEYFNQTTQFMPEAIGEVVWGLAHAGLVVVGRLRPDVARPARPAPWVRPPQALRWQRSLSGVDPLLNGLYRIVGALFRPPLPWLLALLAVVGYAAALVKAPPPPELAVSSLWLLPVLLLGLVWHETAQAMAMKVYGHEVRRIGLGWRGWHPIAFVDTSAIWREGRARRVWVSLAGAVSTLIVGGLAGLATLAGAGSAAATIAWLCVGIALVTLGPGYVSDGAQALDDWLDGRRDPALRRSLYRRWALAHGVAVVGFVAVTVAWVV